MQFIKNDSVPQLIYMYVMIVVSSVVIIIDLLYSALKEGVWSLFHTSTRIQPPEKARSKRYGTHGFASFQDVCLHYVANGKPEKPLILFLHGFPELWYSWRHQLEHYGKDYYAVSFDMRGYGESTKPKDVKAYRLDKLVEDVKNMIEFLGHKKCTLVAHDWGGVVAWYFAMFHPDMLENLIVCNCPHPSAMTRHLRASSSQRWRSKYMMMFQVPCLPEFYFRANDLERFKAILKGGDGAARDGTHSSDDYEIFLHAYSPKGAFSGPLNYYRARFRYGQPVVSSKIIDVPTLIVWGTNDQFLETPLASLSASYCPKSTVKFIANASHWVQQEEPTIVNQHIDDFLASKKGVTAAAGSSH